MAVCMRSYYSLSYAILSSNLPDDKSYFFVPICANLALWSCTSEKKIKAIPHTLHIHTVFKSS